MLETELQQSLRRILPLKHFVLTGYARNGIYLFIKAKGWDKGAEIIIPAFTCPIVSTAITASGVRPVPVDSEPDGLNIDPEKVAGAVTPRTKAVYVVHTYGSAARIEEIGAIAKQHGLVVIEDLAHALAYKLNERELGTFGDIAVLSFTKKLINFEGGAIGLSDTGIYEKMRGLRHSLQKDRRPSFQDLLDAYVRLVGSWWESSFSFPALVFMKMNDLGNTIFYKGGYGLSVDPSKFVMNEYAMRLTLRQLDRLSRMHDNSRYVEFRDRFRHGIDIASLNQAAGDTLPVYYSGIPKKKKTLMKALSFRTWHNITPDPRYPRAEHLYASYRIFARTIFLARGFM